MPIISFRSEMPAHGKAGIVEERVRFTAQVFARHGAKTKIMRVISGDQFGRIAFIAFYDDFTSASDIVLAASADPVLKAAVEEERMAPATAGLPGSFVYEVEGWPENVSYSLVKHYDVDPADIATVAAEFRKIRGQAADLQITVVPAKPKIGPTMNQLRVDYLSNSLVNLGKFMDRESHSETHMALTSALKGKCTFSKSRIIELL